MKIVVASDHAGYEHKEAVKKYLLSKGYEVLDVGTNSKDSTDYPIFGKAAAEKVVKKEADFGVLICSTGEGIMIAANKVKGIRAGLAYNDDVASKLRSHNDANMIAFGALYTSVEDMLRRIDIFLMQKFEGGRHERRIKLID